MTTIIHNGSKEMPMKSEESVVLVTGASSGIGEAAAERLAAAGFKVYGTSRRADHAASRRFEILPLDVTNDESVEAAVGLVIRRGGRIDVLVNNAGFGVAPPGRKRAPSTRPGRSSTPTSSESCGCRVPS